MKDKHPYKFIKPKLVDVGRGLEPAAIDYVRRSGGARQVFRLPPNGSRVPWFGSEGLFWKRRLAEGAVEVIDEPKRAAAPQQTKRASAADTE